MSQAHESPPSSFHVSDRTSVQLAIKKELEETSRAARFVVKEAYREGPLVVVTTDVVANKDALNENLEDSVAIWDTPSNGWGYVVSAVPAKAQLTLLGVTQPLPDPKASFAVLRPRYLEALDEVWRDDAWFEEVLDWYNRRRFEPNVDPEGILPVPNELSLREKQKLAMSLPSYPASYLWGPPGTGKTFTLGGMLASLLRSRADARVLLVATTNSAVDQALVAVDQALELIERQVSGVSRTRRDCIRSGTKIKATNYQGRGHLLPQPDETVLAELAALEANRPAPEDLMKYAAWKGQLQALRMKLRTRLEQLLTTHRLVAMTATAATFNLAALRASGPFDLVVFDEASQLSLAQAVALAPLGGSVLFAGDPKQLAPITLDDHPVVRRWLACSAFGLMEPGQEHCVQLDEQSRMCERICRVVASTFYWPSLRVAASCEQDFKWKRERIAVFTPTLGNAATAVVPVQNDGAYNFYRKGPYREESVWLCAQLVAESVQAGQDPETILVVTPYHAQRLAIRDAISRHVSRKVTVATVHSIQGSEQHTVIFDPVQGGESFFREQMGGDRLINVAMSRAMARLVLLLSPGDRMNPTLRRIAAAIEPPPDPRVPSVLEWKNRPDYPRCLLGQRVRTPVTVGTVTKIPGGGFIEITPDLECMPRRFELATLEQAAKPRIAPVQPAEAPRPRPPVIVFPQKLKPTVVPVVQPNPRLS